MTKGEPFGKPGHKSHSSLSAECSFSNTAVVSVYSRRRALQSFVMRAGLHVRTSAIHES